MERSERLEVINTLLESGKSDEAILNYFTNDLELDIKVDTLKKDIREVRKQNEDPQGEDDSKQNDGDKDAGEDKEATQAPKPPTQEEKVKAAKADDEANIEALMEAIKGDRLEEIVEDAKDKLKGPDHDRFTRLVNVAKARIALEVSNQKAQDAKKERAKFIKDLGKHVGPAIKDLENAQASIIKAIKFKRQSGKNVRALVSVNKVLTRQLKSLSRQVND
jgi:hypothetical protein